MIFSDSRPGFTFLLSVLAVGTIAIATTISLLLLGGAAERSALTMVQSAQSLEAARTCAERALLSLKSDLSYAGGETLSVGSGSCTILGLGGGGNEERTLCVQGKAGEAIRRLEIRLERVYPQAVVSYWQEVPSFSLCQ